MNFAPALEKIKLVAEELGKLRDVTAGEVAAAYKDASGAAQDSVRQTLGLTVY